MKKTVTTLLRVFLLILMFALLFVWEAPDNNSSSVERWSMQGGRISDTIFDNVRFGMDEAQLYTGLGVDGMQKYRFNQAQLSKYEFDVEPSFVDGGLKDLKFIVKSEDDKAITDEEFEIIANALSEQYGRACGTSTSREEHGWMRFWKSDISIKQNVWIKGNLKIELRRKETKGDTFFLISYEDLREDVAAGNNA